MRLAYLAVSASSTLHVKRASVERVKMLFKAKNLVEATKEGSAAATQFVANRNRATNFSYISGTGCVLNSQLIFGARKIQGHAQHDIMNLCIFMLCVKIRKYTRKFSHA